MKNSQKCSKHFLNLNFKKGNKMHEFKKEIRNHENTEMKLEAI